jgi:hypothetical protein
MTQIAWFEVILKGGLGAALMLVPLSTLRLLGLHRDANRFWPRLAGLLMAGIAAGTAVPLLLPAARGGIGPAGHIAINLLVASGLLSGLVWGTAAPFRRGRLFILVLGLTLLALAFLEIAHV